MRQNVRVDLMLGAARAPHHTERVPVISAVQLVECANVIALNNFGVRACAHVWAGGWFGGVQEIVGALILKRLAPYGDGDLGEQLVFVLSFFFSLGKRNQTSGGRFAFFAFFGGKAPPTPFRGSLPVLGWYYYWRTCRGS